MYAVTITCDHKKFAKAVAAMKRYGGTYDGAGKVWLFDERPHAAAAQWGDVEVYDSPDQGDWDYDSQARYL